MAKRNGDALRREYERRMKITPGKANQTSQGKKSQESQRNGRAGVSGEKPDDYHMIEAYQESEMQRRMRYPDREGSSKLGRERKKLWGTNGAQR